MRLSYVYKVTSIPSLHAVDVTISDEMFATARLYEQLSA
jgi:hypothetical protein